MERNDISDRPPVDRHGLRQIAASSLKLGTIGFGGVAGMVSTIENEMVIRRKWIDHEHFMDVLSTSYLIPGPNAVEIVMHCGKERGGRLGLVIAGICYIFPASVICLVLGYFYKRYAVLPDVQAFIYGLRPATTALVIATVVRLSGSTFKKNRSLVLLCLLVFTASLFGVNEVLLILLAGLVNYFLRTAGRRLYTWHGVGFSPLLLQIDSCFSNARLFAIFLKIGAILYGSGYVLFAYMEESLVRKNHWLTHQQLVDAIAVGQITPGPILSSATFSGYLISGIPGGVLATVGIFLPSFFISFFLHRIVSAARKSNRIRLFMDGLSAASISIIAVVGFHLLQASLASWKELLILALCLLLPLFFKKINTVLIILIGSLLGFILFKWV